MEGKIMKNCSVLVVCFMSLLCCCERVEKEKKERGTRSTAITEGIVKNQFKERRTDWEDVVAQKDCKQETLKELRKKWYQKFTAEEGNIWTGLQKRIDSGVTPPPIMCNNECPVEMKQNIGVGLVRFSDDVASWSEKEQIDTGEPIIHGVYRIDPFESNSGKIYEFDSISFHLLDFPSNCIFYNGKPLLRTVNIPEIANVFETCIDVKDEWHSAKVCNKGAIILSLDSIEGPLITLKKQGKLGDVPKKSKFLDSREGNRE
jgi:hypothetical protein